MTDTLARDLGAALGDVERALHAAQGSRDTLQRLVDLAVATIRGCGTRGFPSSSDEIHTSAASDDIPGQIDRIQYDTIEGPCLDAIRKQTIYVTGDLRTEQRWPVFATRATEETGVRSMLSVSLLVEGDTVGALDLYSRRRDAFDVESLIIGRLFAAHAAIALPAMTEDERSERRPDLSGP